MDCQTKNVVYLIQFAKGVRLRMHLRASHGPSIGIQYVEETENALGVQLIHH